MNRGIGSLLLVLALQCALVAIVYWPQAPTDNGSAQTMLPFDPHQVSELHIGDEFDNETVLQKVGERWLLPELEGLPANAAMVEALMQAMGTTNGGWPVADTVAARQRFRVASYHYRRRIRLLDENSTVLGTVLLGTSPGFRQVYARNEHQDAIYSIPFNTHDAPGISGPWLDTRLLQIRAPLRIVADSYSLQREGDQWRSGMGLAPDELELQALLESLRNVQIDGLASEDAQRELAEAEADLVLAVQSLAGEITLELFHQGDAYFVHSSEYPLFFTISAQDYDRLSGVDLRLISGEGASKEAGN